MNREEFEKLPEIVENLKFVKFNEEINKYESNLIRFMDFYNGAWYAYQEQQKNINEALREISRAINCCESIETECVLVELKGYLK